MSRAKRPEIPRGMGWITERGGKYQAHWREGEKYPARTAHSWEEAYKILQDVAAAKGKAAHRGYVLPSELTIDRLITDYLDANDNDLSPNTIGTYRRRAKSFIAPYLGDRLVAVVDTPQVQEWVRGLKRKGVAPSTIDGARAVLTGAYKHAAILGTLTNNPVTGVRLPTIKQVRHTTWTILQVRKVFDAVKDDAMMHAFYRLAITTGMRPGEIRKLQWSDINLARGIVHLQRHESRDEDGHIVEVEGSKTGEGRDIVVPASTIDALKVWRQEQGKLRLSTPGWVEQGYVFTGQKGTSIAQSRIQARHELAITAAGVDRITLHELRHTFSTISLKNGASIKVISKMLGHTTVQMTMDIYMHVSVEMQASVADDLERSLLG